jgi:hypothetical protein
MSRFLSTLFLVALTATVASAQLGGYLPKDCQAAALEEVAPGLPDAQIVAIMNIGGQIPFGNTSISIGINPEDGKAPLWLYVIYSESEDSISIIPMARLLVVCTSFADQLENPDFGIEPGEVLLEPVPTTYLQGSQYISALKTDATYNAYRAAFPDSVPLITVLAKPTETFPGFDPNNHLWLMSFVSTRTGENMTCVTDASNGQTVCVRDEVNSVSDDAAKRGVLIMPNPTTDNAVSTMPAEWIGRHVNVDIFDIFGARVGSERLPGTGMLTLPITGLASGNYHVVLRVDNDRIVAPLVITR